MTWARGCDAVEQLVADGKLEMVSGDAANGAALLASAGALLESARRELDRNPEAAYVLVYDAARKASAALLAQQGLRTRSAGHHVTVEQVVRAQFGGPFDEFGALRRRRSEIEYPQRPGDAVDRDETRVAIERASAIVSAAATIIKELRLFRP